MFKDKKNIIILILSAIILIMIIGSVAFFITRKVEGNTHIDGSKLSSLELLEMFKKEGYEIRITELDGTLYIILNNKREGITIQRIPNTLLGTMMTFDDDSINNEMADLITLSYNNTKEKEQQYKAYENWMKYYNITRTQLSEMLDDYYRNNKDKTETINTEELLKTIK